MIADLARLARVRIGLLAAAGAVAGQLLWQGRGGPLPWASALAAFLLAAGCSALNQAQEGRRDALMARTRHRPLPAGRLSRAWVLGLALVWLGLALALLWDQGGLAPVGLGLAVILIYNGIYTPLKGVTPWCLLLGAVAGALPPLLGWLLAGGPPDDFRALLLVAVFYLWQIPHFALLARRHPADYRAAGLPLAWPARGSREGRWSLLVWLTGYAALVALTPALGLVGNPAAKLALAGLALALVLAGAAVLRRERLGYRLLSLSLVYFLACVIVDAAWLGA